MVYCTNIRAGTRAWSLSWARSLDTGKIFLVTLINWSILWITKEQKVGRGNYTN